MKQVSLTLLFALALCSAALADDRPNILWVIVDDMSANFSCYGETQIETPNVDQFAQRGTKFTKAFVTAPVCSTCRSAFITGMYQTSIGAHHHRSGRGEAKITLPENVTPIPVLFQKAGYHTSVGSWPGRKGRLGKTDYNFEADLAMYDAGDWSSRETDQPFFAQIQLQGGKLRGASHESYEKLGKRIEQSFDARTDPKSVQLPIYYPRDPEILLDWAAYLDSVRETDRVFGEILARLESDGVLEKTVVLFMTDHGISHVRGKQFMYEEGLHVPLVIAGPGVQTGTRSDLVEHIDIAALSLSLAGIPIPETMQAQDILAKDYQPRDAVYAARDRCDETVDHLRSVRTEKYKYIRNFLPQRPYLQPNAYKDGKTIMVAMRKAYAEGRLNAVQSLIMAETRPPEELYDLESDPDEIHNLADQPEHAKTLATLRSKLDQWMESTGDIGRQPEPATMFDSDMQVYLKTLKVRNPTRLPVIEANIQQMKDWAAAGK
ncbi:MAG: sulfatase [Rubripirellula sp.]